MDLTPFEPGARLHGEGRLDEAEAAYRALLAGPSEQAAMAHQLLGALMTDRGDPDAALAQYDEALALGAASAELFFRRGALMRGVGRLEAALESYDRGLALDADRADAHHARGVVLAALGRLESALACYDHAIALTPAVKNYWNNRGVALEGLGRAPDAVANYDHAIALDPYYARAHHNRGSALLKLDRADAALASFELALAGDPGVPETWNFKAVAEATLEDYPAALASADRALVLRPAYAEAHNNRSVALRALKRPEEALTAAEAALAARPNFAEALNSKASALSRLQRYEEACDAYRLALDGRPTDPAIRLNFGMALEALGDLDAARAAFAEAEVLAPALPDARFARGLVDIRAGDLRAGFERYETRWTQKGGPRHGYPQASLWLGQEPLGERTLLVHAEQGFGDVIQFCRFAPRAAPPSRLTLMVQPALKRLMTSLEGVSDVRAVGDSAPAFDRHIPIMSLPLALDLALEDLAPAAPYLHAAPILTARWRSILPSTTGLRVGLAWSGNPGHDNDHNRSMTLAALGPLLRADVQFVSLQKDYRPADRAILDKTPQVLRFDTMLGDFADTAALIACCDLVIAVDTAVAHLAGALGKPLWLLLPRFCDWRWMNDRKDSPWYPSARLYRQATFGAWADVAASVASDLGSL